MDHANHQDRDPSPARAAPKPTAPAQRPEEGLLDLQRTAGNRAVAELMTVQRHSLDPNQMDDRTSEG